MKWRRICSLGLYGNTPDETAIQRAMSICTILLILSFILLIPARYDRALFILILVIKGCMIHIQILSLQAYHSLEMKGRTGMENPQVVILSMVGVHVFIYFIGSLMYFRSEQLSLLQYLDVTGIHGLYVISSVCSVIVYRLIYRTHFGSGKARDSLVYQKEKQ